MKILGTIAVVLAATLGSGGAAPAQTSPAKPAAIAPTPDLSKIDAGKILKELVAAKATTGETNSQDVTPLQVIAAFLQLNSGQVNQLEQLLQARREALAPRIQQVQTLGQQLDALLTSGGNPAQIGLTVIQIHELQQQIAQIQQAFLTQLIAMLDPDQLQRLHAIQIAAELQPILPAFRLIFPF